MKIVENVQAFFSKLNTRLKISTRFLAMTLLAILLSVISITVVSSIFFLQYISQADTASVSAGLANLQTQTNLLKNQASQVSNLVAWNKEVAAAVRRGDTNALNSTMTQLFKTLQCSTVTVVDQSNKVLYSTNPAMVGQGYHSPAVSQSLENQSVTSVEEDIYGTLSSVAATPIVGGDGTVIGSVEATCSLEDTSLVDTVKKLSQTDVTIYDGPNRTTTTLRENGQRAISIPMDASISDAVMQQGKTITGRYELFGENYLCTYAPLRDAQNQIVGAFFAGVPTTAAQNIFYRFLGLALMVILILLALFVPLIYLYVRTMIAKPLHLLVETADQVALGQVDLTENLRSLISKGKAKKDRNEIYILAKSFARMIGSIRQQTRAAQELAQGNFNVRLVKRSEGDVLTESLRSMVQSVQKVSGEVAKIIEAVDAGNLSLRADETGLNGGYASIVSVLNRLLNGMSAELQKEEAARDVAEKQSLYQKQAVERLVVAIRALSEGNLECGFTVVPPDADTQEQYTQLETIRASLKQGVDSIKSYIDEISRILSRMAEGSLDNAIERKYVGDFSQMKDSINAINMSLNHVLGEINTAADQVATGARQVSESSQALSQGATEQASAVEELTSTISTIAEQTKHNAANAAKANALSLRVKTNASAGTKKVEMLISSMEEIRAASVDVTKIVKMIDSIAFQTNMLALNAAVEAARAGQYGRGFAVVADEVRNLAQRSADAVKETTGMLEGMSHKVENGAKVVAETAQVFYEISSGIDESTALVKDIADASNEQASGIAQVDRGVEQVSMVVQTTSATAEEEAASSEELSAQAAVLKEMVGHFSLMDRHRLQDAQDEAAASPSLRLS